MSQSKPIDEGNGRFPTPVPNQSAVDASNALTATAKFSSAPPAAAQTCAESDCMDVDDAVDYLQDNREPKTNGHCAVSLREAIAEGGIELDPATQPGSAKDYGPYLEEHGFIKVEVVENRHYEPKKGDVAVIQGYPAGQDKDGKPYKENIDGHIEMWDGKERWVSGFYQQDKIYPGRGYRAAQPDYAIYRPPTASSRSLSPAVIPQPSATGE